LAEIGRAMLVYANDYDGELPRAEGTISSSFYLLVKYAGVAPKSFVCPGDVGTTAFDPADDGVGNMELVDLWDFGLVPSEHCSYSYHMPYCLYPLTTSSEPDMAVAADRNPWIESPAARDKVDMFVVFNPDGDRDAVKAGNAIAHQEEGQNVLFLDCHVSFEDDPFCGVNDDNIYTFWTGGDIRRGGMPIPGFCTPMDRLDSLLVHDTAPYKVTTTTKQSEAVDSANLKQTSVVATLDCPMPEHRNVIWCSTFQMAWDRLEDDIIGEPIQVLGAEELAARLNRAKVSEADLEPESFYATVGFVRDGIIEQIQQEMAKRFPSESVPVFGEKYSTLPEPIVAYSFLSVDVGFRYPFYTKDTAFSFEDSNGMRTDVTSFSNDTPGGAPDLARVREQVDILYYKYGEQGSGDEFAVDLCKDTRPYQVVLALVPQSNTLGEAVAAVEKGISEFKQDPHYEVLRKLRPIDTLIVPDILYKLEHNFKELLGKYLGNSRWRYYFFFDARQMIDFALSRTGVTVKSWALLAIAGVAAHPRIEEPRHLYFNRPFLVYVKKRGPDYCPFFVMWVDNAELMKEF